MLLVTPNVPASVASVETSGVRGLVDKSNTGGWEDEAVFTVALGVSADRDTTFEHVIDVEEVC